MSHGNDSREIPCPLQESPGNTDGDAAGPPLPGLMSFPGDQVPPLLADFLRHFPLEWRQESLMSRWYDRHGKLGTYLDALKDMDPHTRDRAIQGIMLLIKENAPSLLEDFVLHFPLELHRRRWYDHDPYLWLVFNGLQYADEEFLAQVASYLERFYP